MISAPKICGNTLIPEILFVWCHCKAKSFESTPLKSTRTFTFFSMAAKNAKKATKLQNCKFYSFLLSIDEYVDKIAQ